MSLSVEQTIEMACAELEHFIVVSVYRPPTGLYEHFEIILEQVLVKLSGSRKLIVVCGDFNINLLDNSTTCIRFRSLLNSYNLDNLFLEPTRITHCSATCIDNIFTNSIPCKKSIINMLSSDHCGQLASFHFGKNIINKNKKNVCIPMTTGRVEKF